MLEKALAGSLNLLVKFSTLQEYGVDKPFFLENDNVDSSQRNVVFLVRGEKAKTVMAVAGMFDHSNFLLHHALFDIRNILGSQMRLGRQLTLCLVSLDPNIKNTKKRSTKQQSRCNKLKARFIKHYRRISARLLNVEYLLEGANICL